MRLLKLKNLLVLLGVGALVAGGILLQQWLSGPGPNTANDIVEQAFSGKNGLKSGKVDLTTSIQVEGIPAGQAPAIKLSGSFENIGKGKLPKFDLNLGSVGGQSDLTYGAVNTGTAGFLKAKGISYTVPQDVYDEFKKAYEQSASGKKENSSAPSLSSLGIKPVHWLKDPKIVGEETVAGIKTTHVKSSIDIAELAADLIEFGSKFDSTNPEATINTAPSSVPSGLGGLLNGAQGQTGASTSSGQVPPVPTTTTPTTPTTSEDDIKQQVSEAVESADFDLYVGSEDRLLRKLQVVIKFKVPKSGGQLFAGTTTGTFTFTLSFTDIGQTQNIIPPGGAKSSTQFKLALAQFNPSEIIGLLGGLSSQLPLSPGTGTTGVTAPPISGTDTLSTTTTDTSTSPSTSTSSVPPLSDKTRQCILNAKGNLEKVRKCVNAGQAESSK